MTDEQWYAIGAHIKLAEVMVEFGYPATAVVVSFCASETDQYTVRFPDGTLRKLHLAQIAGTVG